MQKKAHRFIALLQLSFQTLNNIDRVTQLLTSNLDPAATRNGDSNCSVSSTRPIVKQPMEGHEEDIE